MIVFWGTLIGIVIYGDRFVKLNILGIETIYICMFFLAFNYLKFFLNKKNRLQLTKNEVRLVYFVIYGLIRVVLSLTGITDFLVSDELFVNVSYIPRQAYYLFFLPAIIVAPGTRELKWFMDLLVSHRKKIFFLIYAIKIVLQQEISLGVTSVLFLGYLSLLKKKNTKTDYVMFLLIMFTPIAVGGEMTNVLVRMVYFVYFFVKRKKKIVTLFMSYGIKVAILSCFIIPMIADMFKKIFDANTMWRALYWYDEIKQVISSWGLGVGYGTSYASSSFVGNTSNIIGGPFGATAEYSVMDQLFVTGPHNSFVSILFRLGVVGLLLFFKFVSHIGQKNLHYIHKISSATLFAYVSVIIIILTNVGLESPYYLVFFVFSIVMCVYECEQAEESVG